MKINLKSSVLLLILVFACCLHGGGGTSKAEVEEPKVYFKDSLLGTLPKEIANYILFLAEYQQMLDTRIAKTNNRYCYICTMNDCCIDFPEKKNNPFSVCHAISNDKSKMLFTHWSARVDFCDSLYTLTPKIALLLNIRKPFEIAKGAAALSNDGRQVFYVDDETNKIQFIKLRNTNAKKSEENTLKLDERNKIDIPSFESTPNNIRLGYLDTFKQLCLITKAKHKPEKTTFIDLNQFGSCPVDKSKNLLHRFVLTEEVKRLYEDQFKK